MAPAERVKKREKFICAVPKFSFCPFHNEIRQGHTYLPHRKLLHKFRGRIHAVRSPGQSRTQKRRIAGTASGTDRKMKKRLRMLCQKGLIPEDAPVVTPKAVRYKSDMDSTYSRFPDRDAILSTYRPHWTKDVISHPDRYSCLDIAIAVCRHLYFLEYDSPSLRTVVREIQDLAHDKGRFDTYVIRDLIVDYAENPGAYRLLPMNEVQLFHDMVYGQFDPNTGYRCLSLLCRFYGVAEPDRRWYRSRIRNDRLIGCAFDKDYIFRLENEVLRVPELLPDAMLPLSDKRPREIDVSEFSFEKLAEALGDPCETASYPPVASALAAWLSAKGTPVDRGILCRRMWNDICYGGVKMSAEYLKRLEAEAADQPEKGTTVIRTFSRGLSDENVLLRIAGSREYSPELLVDGLLSRYWLLFPDKISAIRAVGIRRIGREPDISKVEAFSEWCEENYQAILNGDKESPVEASPDYEPDAADRAEASMEDYDTDMFFSDWEEE